MAASMFSPMKLQAPSVTRLTSDVLVKATSRFACARSVFLAAGALLGLLTLGGCGGGGGGGGGNPDGIAPVAFVYPPSLAAATSTDNVDGIISPYALDSAGTTISTVNTTVFGTSPSVGKITITISDITLPLSGGTEPGFVVTFDPTSGSSTPNSPLESLPSIASSFPGSSLPCTGCLKTTTAFAVVNGVTTTTMVTFIYLDPTSASFPLKYSALGMWTKPTDPLNPSWPEVGGAFSAGVMTRGVDLPTTGSAQYEGYFIGRYATSVNQLPGGADTSAHSAGTYIVGANASATATFGAAGSVMFQTTNTFITPEAGGGPAVAESRLNLTSTAMPIVPTSTSNGFAGAVGTGATGFFAGTPGNIAGAFYGPPSATTPFAPPEAGGALSVSNSTQSMVGSFAVKTPAFK